MEAERRNAQWMAGLFGAAFVILGGAAFFAAFVVGIWLLIVLGALAITALVISVVYAQKSSRLRLAIWTAAADARGWNFFAEDTQKRHKSLAEFGPFARGRRAGVSDIVQGKADGRPFEIFRYQYTVSHGKSSTTYLHRIGWIETPVRGPNLTISGEHGGHKILKVFGGEDINTESDEFSRRFWVKCDNRRWAYDILHPRMTQWLLDVGGRKWNWEWRGDKLMVWDMGHLKLEDWDLILPLLTRFVALVPRHVVAGAEPAPKRPRAASPK